MHRYTFRPQEKTIFAILLEWPDQGSVVLSEPVVTSGVTKVKSNLLYSEVGVPAFTGSGVHVRELSLVLLISGLSCK